MPLIERISKMLFLYKPTQQNVNVLACTVHIHAHRISFILIASLHNAMLLRFKSQHVEEFR